MNTATALRNALGIETAGYLKQPRNYSFTKKGPGRIHHHIDVRKARQERQQANHQ
jgi:hypothetical protein